MALIGGLFFVFLNKSQEKGATTTSVTYLYKKRKRLQRKWSVLKYKIRKKNQKSRYTLHSTGIE